MLEKKWRELPYHQLPIFATLKFFSLSQFTKIDSFPKNQNRPPIIIPLILIETLWESNFLDNQKRTEYKSICGFCCPICIQKDRLFEIDVFLADVLEDGFKNRGLLGKWFGRLKGYYENKFGPDWLDEYKGAWQWSHSPRQAAGN